MLDLIPRLSYASLGFPGHKMFRLSSQQSYNSPLVINILQYIYYVGKAVRELTLVPYTKKALDTILEPFCWTLRVTSVGFLWVHWASSHSLLTGDSYGL